MPSVEDLEKGPSIFLRVVFSEQRICSITEDRHVQNPRPAPAKLKHSSQYRSLNTLDLIQNDVRFPSAICPWPFRPRTVNTSGTTHTNVRPDESHVSLRMGIHLSAQIRHAADLTGSMGPAPSVGRRSGAPNFRPLWNSRANSPHENRPSARLRSMHEAAARP